MSDLAALRRLAILAVVVAVVIGVPSTVAFFGAFGFDLEAAVFGEPSAVLGGGPAAASLLHWGAIGDMFFSYLLLVPLALYLHATLRPRGPWLADLATVGALVYIFVGASGAAILATAGPSLIEANATAAPPDRLAIATSFDMLRNAVFFGLWQTLDPISLGTWIVGVGWLIRSDRRTLGLLLVALGVAAYGFSVQTMFGLHSLVLLVVGVMVPVLVWLGSLVWDRTRRER